MGCIPTTTATTRTPELVSNLIIGHRRTFIHLCRRSSFWQCRATTPTTVVLFTHILFLTREPTSHLVLYPLPTPLTSNSCLRGQNYHCGTRLPLSPLSTTGYVQKVHDVKTASTDVWIIERIETCPISSVRVAWPAEPHISGVIRPDIGNRLSTDAGCRLSCTDASDCDLRPAACDDEQYRSGWN